MNALFVLANQLFVHFLCTLLFAFSSNIIVEICKHDLLSQCYYYAALLEVSAMLAYGTYVYVPYEDGHM